ncbi:hypothetical protein CIPAW_04G173200 [Carya illinoinensis]|uniref:Uncharacterized protein n=1 Tax=Carya illinoinensis TaxID=32201 RepID=A0A8T1QWU0_CARIL|nr:hypothetical protein CIPAW_04G173200 [Carya illinoinensis]
MILCLVRFKIWTITMLVIAYHPNYYLYWKYVAFHQTGVAYSKHMMQLYTYQGGNDIRHLEVFRGLELKRNRKELLRQLLFVGLKHEEMAHN